MTQPVVVSEVVKGVMKVLKRKSAAFKNSLIEKLHDKDYIVPDGYCEIHDFDVRKELTCKLGDELIPQQGNKNFFWIIRKAK